METSLFSAYVQKWFGALVSSIYTLLNGSKEAPKYLFKQYLTKKYSATLKWDGLTADGSIVSADVVAVNSSLPLKKRDSLKRASGDVPKLGMKLSMNERQLLDIQIMEATNTPEKEIVKAIFNDVTRVVGGIYERLEFMFLEALSTGVTQTLDDDPKNVGTGIRLDYGYISTQKRGVAIAWNGSNITPITDIERVLTQASAKGVTIRKLMMDKWAWNYFRKSAEVINLFAFANGFAGSNVIKPNLQQVNEALESNMGIMIEIVDRSIRTEKNGVQTLTKPWAEGQVVFLSSDKVGSLYWGNLAEKLNPVKQAEYQTVDDYILVSKYSVNDPLAEFTSSQAHVCPVIENVGDIFILDTKTVEA